MEWTPSEKMTVTDLRAVFASWDVPTISNDKGVLADEVTRCYLQIMLLRSSRRTAVPSFIAGLPVFPPGVSRSSGDDKSIGTDCPRTERSYIGSDEPPYEDESVPESNFTDLDRSLVRDFEATCIAHDKMRDQTESSAACAAAPEELPAEVPDEVPVESAAAAPEETPVQSSAAAAATYPDEDELSRPVVRSTGLRRALELEEEATAAKAKAKAGKAKAKKAVAKSHSKLLYGYLPMGGVSIDEDMKKGNDQDNLDA